MALFQPFDAIKKTSAIELVGADEQLAQNNYADAAEASLSLGNSTKGSGMILSALLISEGGAILEPTGELLIFSADPGHSLNASAIAAASLANLIGKVSVGASNWVSDANGAHAWIETAVPFESASSLFLVFRLTSATSINSAGGDDETLKAVLRYRRDS